MNINNLSEPLFASISDWSNSNSLLITCTTLPKSEWIEYWKLQNRKLILHRRMSVMYWCNILTFINPGAKTISPEASTHLCLIRGHIFIVGFSKGNFGPKLMTSLKFPALVGNSTEYSLSKLISVTLIWHLCYRPTYSWYSEITTISYFSLNTFNVSICCSRFLAGSTLLYKLVESIFNNFVTGSCILSIGSKVDDTK